MKKCINCEFIAKSEFALQFHIESEHRNPPVLTFPCPTCGLTFGDIKDFDNQVKRSHTVQGAPELSKPESDMKHYLKYIIEQNQEIMEEFCDFKQKKKLQSK